MACVMLSKNRSGRLLRFAVSNVRITRATTSEAISGDAIKSDSSHNGKPMSALPGPIRVPVLSFLADLVKFSRDFGVGSMHRDMWKTFEKYGNVARYQFLTIDMVVVSDPDTVSEICWHEENDPSNVDRELTFLQVFGAVEESRQKHKIPGVIPLREQDHWVRTRHVLAKKLLRPVGVKDFFTTFDGAAQDFVNALRSGWNEHQEIDDLGSYIKKWSLESFSRFTFGEKANVFTDSPNETLVWLHEAIPQYYKLGYKLSAFKKYTFLVPGLSRQLDKQTLAIQEEGTKLVDKVLGILAEDPNGKTLHHQSLIAYLLKQNHASITDIVSQGTDMVEGAVSTVRHSASWMMYLIGQNPDVQEKLYDEIRRTLPGKREVTYSAIQKMPYLRGCVKEVVRLWPVAFCFSRAFNTEVKAGGYVFPPKTIFACSTFNMGRSEAIFPEPLKMKPERWFRETDMEDGNKRPHPFSSLAFGYGPHSCTGRRAAELQLQALLAQTVANFKVHYTGEEQQGIIKLVLCLDKKLKVKLEDRD